MSFNIYSIEERRFTGPICMAVNMLGGDPIVTHIQTQTRDVEVKHPPFPKMDERRARVILRMLLEETLSQLLPYKKPYLDKAALVELLYNQKGAGAGYEDMIADEFLSMDMIDSMTVDLNNFLMMVVSEGVWLEWIIIDQPYGIYLASGDDHRIMEYNRRHGNCSATDSRIDVYELIRYIRGSIAPPQVSLNWIKTIILDVIADISGNVFSTDGSLAVESHDLGKRESIELANRVKEAVTAFYRFQILNQYFPKGRFFDIFFRGDRYIYSKPRNDNVSSRMRRMIEIKLSVQNGDFVPKEELDELYNYEQNNGEVIIA